MLTTMVPYSFVEQDFIWVGDYMDGTSLAEYSPVTKERMQFSDLRKQNLVRFGLVGHGSRLLFEVGGGFFKLNGTMYEFVYKVGNKEYYLTGQFTPYNDVVTYKDAEAWANLTPRDAQNFPTTILAYNVGYKKKLQIEGVQFHIQAVVNIPADAPINFRIRLVASKALNGQLVIKRNGTPAAIVEAPLEEGVGGELQWVVIQ